ncbi:MAG: hypothetical protein U5K37_00355 [Natrialbaceae archaeon]|nr:hypothetical protein [Natrialbaceae archaeon]
MMAPSGWIIAYVVLFALLHMVLYIVYSRHEMEEYTTGMSIDSRGCRIDP